MRLTGTLVLLCVLLPPFVSATEFFVSPQGSSGGDGTRSRPWDLDTALSAVGVVKPGDTIWMRGGIYGVGARTIFHSIIAGTPSQPVVVRQYPGERATVNGGIQVLGPYAWFWGFEITNTFLTRNSLQPGSFPTDIPQPTGITPSAGMYESVPGVKFLNLIVHDTSNGLSSFSGAPGTEIYGCLTYNNGWIGPDRGHGHGIYVQNVGDAKLVGDNLIFNNFDAGLHAAGSPNATIQNILMTGNAVFNNGQAGGHRVDNIIAEGGGAPLQGLLLDGNHIYDPAAPVGNAGYNRIGWQFDSVNQDVTLRNNVWVGGDPGLMLANWTNVTFTGNTLYAQTNSATNYNGQLQLRLLTGQNSTGYVWDYNTYYASGWRMFMLYQNNVSTWSGEFPFWQTSTGLDAHSQVVDSKPTGVWTYVRPNRYEPGRAHLVIYNWALQPSVSVDISGVGLAIGQKYEVRDAQNFFGDPVAAGTYNGQPISVAMNGLTVVQPTGAYPFLLHTAPEFGAFVVLPVAGSGSTVNQPPAVSAGSESIVTIPNLAPLNGYVQDDGLPSGTLTSVWSMVSGPGSVTFGNPALPVTTASFSVAGVYVLRLTASDGALTVSATVTIRVSAASNQAPTVSAGPNASVGLSNAPLNGSVQDDGLPSGTLSSTWSMVSGPGTVTFANASSPVTTATFSVAGTYVLRLTASDTALTASADTTITVRAGNLPPTVSAGSNLTVTLPNAASLAGSVHDDGLPSGTLSSTWSLVSGPGTVTFANASSPVTTAAFSVAGTYVLRLTASDTALTASADATITVRPANLPPTVSAGSNLTVTLPNAASLTGSVQDDGLPSGILIIAWSMVSGPGSVTFSDPSSRTTTASFAVAGTYVLRLSASDGALTTTADVTVTVQHAPPSTVGLAAYWTFDAPQTNTYATRDQSGNQFDAIFHGAVGTAAGTIGEAMAFSGGYLTADSDARTNSPTQLVNDLTLAVWVKTTNTTRWEGLIAKYVAGVNENGYVLRTTPAGNIGLRIGNANLLSGSSATTDTGTVVNDGRWHHVAAVIRLGQNVTYYIDGNQSSVQPVLSKAGVAAVGIWIGRNPWADYGDLFHGSLDDARVYSRALTSQEVSDLAAAGGSAAPVNQPPTVSAGSDATITLPAAASLSGSVQDDGLPSGTLSSTWLKVSGSGSVSFANVNLPATTATFSAAGAYVLRLMASDGALTATSDVTITVQATPPTNRPPTVSAGSDATITLPSAASLTGSVRDDGLPSGTLSSTWSKASGPGSVSFANVSLPVTTATFSAAGAYVLRLTASDGALTATSDVTITVQAGSIPPPVTEDLAAYWPFDAATTTTFGTADQSGNNLNATMHGTLAVSAGRIGEAMVFSGGYLTADSDTAANSKTQLLNDLSLSLWIKTTNTTRWEGLIAKYAAGVKEYGYVLRTTPAGNVGIRIGNSNLVSGNSAITDTTSSINDGRWHHIAVVIHLGQDVTFYVDGRQTSVQTVLSKAASTSVAVWIGRNAWVDYGDLFHGSLDDARIYARALTPQEVASLAAIP